MGRCLDRRVVRGLWAGWALLLAVAVSCGEPAAPPGAVQALLACTGARCRVDRVEAAWRADRQATAQAVARVPDGVSRRLLVLRLLDSFPGQTDLLCEALSAGPERTLCLDRDARPHLAVPRNEPDLEAAGRRAGGGPAEGFLPALEPQNLDWYPDPPDPAAMAPCAERPDPASCGYDLARRALEGGDLPRAAAVCRVAAAVRNEWECFHRAARAVGAGASYPLSARFCSAAGEFVTRCELELLQDHLRPLHAVKTAAQAAAVFVRLARTVEDAWEPVDPRFSEVYLDQFRAMTAARIWRERLATPEAWPPEVYAALLPHLRYRAARELLAGSAPPTGLDEAAERLQALLSGSSASGSPEPATPEDRSPRFWPRDLPGEEALPAVRIEELQRRVRGEDAAADAQICILEAAARRSPPAVALLEQGLHPGRTVYTRWTAARLLGAVAPERLRDRTDEDPRVQARIRSRIPASQRPD